MDLLIQGIIMGLVLSIMVGPILFAILQTSIERGRLGGILFSSGIWFSDIMFITVIFTGFAYIENVFQLPNFEFYGGVIGGVILLAIGLGMALSNRVEKRKPSTSTSQKAKIGAGLWIKGFFFNTFNPFTVFFWMGIVSTGLGFDEFTFEKVGNVFISLMLTIVVIDTLKVLLANKIRDKLNDKLILRTRKISGLALIIFGIIIIVRVNF